MSPRPGLPPAIGKARGPPARTPVTLLTGFLGSGKTTLLARALADPALAGSAVIVNEFGSVSLDHLLVARLSDNVIELRNGCLCCTIHGDLALTLRDLYRRRLLGEIPAFGHVLVETSGMADPVPLVHTLIVDTPLRRGYELDAVVTTFDAEFGARTLADQPAAARQLALADAVVLTKTDLVDAAQRQRALAAIRAVNASAAVHPAVAGDIDPALLFGRDLFDPAGAAAAVERWLGPLGPAGAGHRHGASCATHAIVRAGPSSLAGTTVFLNHVVNAQRDAILRIKGIAGFRERGGRPAVVQAVRDKFYPLRWLDEWPDADHSTRFVFIGRDLDPARLDAEFDRLNA